MQFPERRANVQTQPDCSGSCAFDGSAVSGVFTGKPRAPSNLACLKRCVIPSEVLAEQGCSRGTCFLLRITSKESALGACGT
jgi:hypothetical protein